MTYEVACGGDPPVPVEMVGGRWHGRDGQGAWRGSLKFVGADQVVGRPDIVLVNLLCVVPTSGDPDASSVFVIVRVSDDGATTQAAWFVTTQTSDIRLEADGTIVVGFAGDSTAPYRLVTVTWDGDTPLVGEPVGASPPDAPRASGRTADPSAGLPPTTTIAVGDREPRPAACVATEIGSETDDVADIAALQLALAQRGFDPGGVDGVFGPNTRAAVVQFVGAHRDLVVSFAGGDTAPLADVTDDGTVRTPVLDALGIGCPMPMTAYEDRPVPTTTTTTTSSTTTTTLPPTTTSTSTTTTTLPPTTTSTSTTTTTLPPTTT
ncbi:MAG: peptidoglycan-binding domain-containing protein, partial [Desertimonas sp.]